MLMLPTSRGVGAGIFTATPHRPRGAPRAGRVAHDDRLLMREAVAVAAVTAAVAWRRARHRADLGAPARVERGRARYLKRPAPPARRLGYYERLPVPGAIAVEP